MQVYQNPFFKFAQDIKLIADTDGLLGSLYDCSIDIANQFSRDYHNHMKQNEKTFKK